MVGAVQGVYIQGVSGASLSGCSTSRGDPPFREQHDWHTLLKTLPSPEVGKNINFLYHLKEIFEASFKLWITQTVSIDLSTYIVFIFTRYIDLMGPDRPERR